MSDIILFLVALIIGVVAGILSGLLGIGGGIIFMPVLYYLLPSTGVTSNLVSITAVATSLFAGSFSAGGASLNHYFSKNIEYKKALLIGLGCVTSTVFIPQFAIKFNPLFLTYLLISILIIVFVRFLVSTKQNYNKRRETSNKFLYPVGVVVGALSSLCGIGGGVIIIPFLVNFTMLEMRKVIGTSSVITALTMISSAIVYSLLDTTEIGMNANSSIVAYIIGIPLGIGAFAGSRIGVKMVNQFSDILLKRIFSVFLLVVIISLLLKL